MTRTRPRCCCRSSSRRLPKDGISDDVNRLLTHQFAHCYESPRRGHTETRVSLGLLAVVALVAGIVVTVQRYRHTDQFAWWEWIVMPVIPLGVLILGVTLLLLLVVATDKLGLWNRPCKPPATVNHHRQQGEHPNQE
jgi:hypothetical protein